MHNKVNESDKKNPVIEELNDIMFAIKQRFQPAATVKESNLTLTTSELLEKIREHYPLAELIDNSDMYTLLKQNGFTYLALGDDAKLEWLIRKV